MTRFTLGVLGCLLALAGCGTQVDGDYKGEVQATVKGTLVTTSDTNLSEPMNVALFWAVEDSRTFGQRVAVQGNFPAGFTLDLVEPPKLEWLKDYTLEGKFPKEGRFGVAYIVAYPASLDEEAFLRWAVEDEPLPDGTPVGASSKYIVAWVEDDLQENTLSAGFLGGPLERGFHLIEETSFLSEEEQDLAWAEYDEVCGATSVCEAELNRFIEAEVNDEPSDEAYDAYLQCDYEYRTAPPCSGRNSPAFAQLKPAVDGFDASIDMSIRRIVDNQADLDVPELN